MSDNPWELIDQIFKEALDRQAEQLRKLLDERCAGNSELRHEVESLLASFDEAGDFLSVPPDAHY